MEIGGHHQHRDVRRPRRHGGWPMTKMAKALRLYRRDGRHDNHHPLLCSLHGHILFACVGGRVPLLLVGRSVESLSIARYPTLVSSPSMAITDDCDRATAMGRMFRTRDEV